VRSGRIEQVSFPGSGGDRLSGRLDCPRDDPVAYALFVHCFTCSKEIPAATRITRGLVDRGIGVLRFDFTGLGASEGDFANTNFSSNVEDIVPAADVLRDRGAAPKILVGHSLGGTAVLAAAAQVPEAVAVVTIGAPFDPAQLTRLFADALPDLERAEEVSVEIGGRRSPSVVSCSRTRTRRTSRMRSGRCAGRSSFSMLLRTSSSTSTMPGESSTPPSTRRASSRSAVPITSSREGPMLPMWRRSSPRGPTGTSRRRNNVRVPSVGRGR
jgi:alpha/beta superfamily hydrolase